MLRRRVTAHAAERAGEDRLAGMAVEVRLYGRLRRFAQDPRATAESVAWVPVEGETVVEEVLRRLGIDPGREVSNIFINGRYAYQARHLAVHGGDRIGVFPKDMGLLYC